MVPFICLVSGPDHSNPVGAGTVSFDEKGKRKRADMTAHAGADGNADDQRQPQSVSKVVEVLQTKHQVCFLIADCITGNEIVIPEIIFCLFEFDHGDRSFRGGAEELFTGIGTPGGNACGIGPMPAFIHGGNKRTGILCLESGIDHFTGIFAPICESFRRSPALLGLVPDRCDPRAAVKVTENSIFIVNSAVKEADEHTSPL